MSHGAPIRLVEHPRSELDRNPADFITQDDTLIQGFFAEINAEVVVSTTIPGPDISSWNLGGNFEAMVDGGFPFVVIKAGEALVEDPMFQTHLQKAINAGALIMVYWFFRSNVSGTSQANKCLEVILPLKEYQNKTVVWCDVETADGTSNATRISRVKNFLDTIVAGGYEAGIYCSPSLWTTLMTPVPAWISQFWQWVAHWTSAPLPSLPTGWSFLKCILWQIGIWNDHGWCPAVPGWNPDLDSNKAFFSTREAMETALGITYVVPPPMPELIELEVVVAAEVREEASDTSALVTTLPVGTVIVQTDMQIAGALNVWVEHELGWTRLARPITYLKKHSVG